MIKSLLSLGLSGVAFLAMAQTATAQQWTAQYYELRSDHKILTDQPLTSNFPISQWGNLNLNWGDGGPSEINRVDNFGAIYKRPIAPGIYSVRITGDDGIRGSLEVSGQSQPYFFDKWRVQSHVEPQFQYTTVHVTQSNTWIKIEYFEAGQNANLLVEITPQGSGGGNPGGCGLDQHWSLDHYNGQGGSAPYLFSQSVCGDTLFHEDFGHSQGRFIRATNNLHRRGYYRVHIKADDWAFIYDGQENINGEVDMVRAVDSVFRENGPFHSWQHKKVIDHCFGDNGPARAIIIYQDDASTNPANRAFLQVHFERLGDC